MAAGASVSRPATRAASRCGRWLVRATAASCSSGVNVTGVRAAAGGQLVDDATASGSAGSCGVTAQGRPSKSDALAANGPERSLPAIGWLPT